MDADGTTGELGVLAVEDRAVGLVLLLDDLDRDHIHAVTGCLSCERR
jgi:hypothetical protein